MNKWNAIVTKPSTNTSIDNGEYLYRERNRTKSLCIVNGLALDEYTIHGNDKKGGQM